MRGKPEWKEVNVNEFNNEVKVVPGDCPQKSCQNSGHNLVNNSLDSVDEVARFNSGHTFLSHH